MKNFFFFFILEVFEVIVESYSVIDQFFYFGDVFEFGKNVLVNFGNVYSIIFVGIVFFVFVVVFEKRRKIMVGFNDVVVLSYIFVGGVGFLLFIKLMLRRVIVVVSEYVFDLFFNLVGFVLFFYYDFDVQSFVYEISGVLLGLSRKYVYKGEGVFIYCIFEMVNVEWGRMFF